MEYSWRAIIIESIGAGELSDKNHSICQIPKIICEWCHSKVKREVQWRFWKTSEENSQEGAHCQNVHHHSTGWRIDFFEDPGQSFRKLLLVVGVSEKTMHMHWIIEKDLCYKYYTKKLRQMLSEVARTKQGTQQPVLCSLKNKAAECLKFFFWWKNFTIDVKINIWNDWWLAHVPENVLIIGRTKFPMNVHVLTDVSNKSDVMPPWFFKKRGKYHKRSLFAFSDKHSEVVNGNCVVWKAICFSTGQCVYQHRSFVSKLAVTQLRHVLVWPPNSPDLNSLGILYMECDWKD